MPKMYKLGESKFFRSLQDGLDAGYFESFNAFRASVVGGTPAKAEIPVKMSREQVMRLAEENGLDTTVHHKTLRKQVEELANEEIGSDNSSVRPDQD